MRRPEKELLASSKKISRRGLVLGAGQLAVACLEAARNPIYLAGGEAVRLIFKIFCFLS